MRLKVGTWNIRAGLGASGVLPDTRTGNLDSIAQRIAAAGLQVVLLQEVDRWVARSRRVHQSRYLAKALTGLTGGRWHYLFAPAIRYQGGSYGNAVISSYPLLRYLTLRLRVPGGQAEDRVFLLAVLALPDGECCFLGCFHLSAAQAWMRLREVSKIKEALGRLFPTPPLIIGGDLNEQRNGAVYRLLVDRPCPLVELGPVAGTSYRSGLSTSGARIDFLFGSRVVPINAGITEADTCSDHDLVWAECELKPGLWGK